MTDLEYKTKTAMNVTMQLKEVTESNITATRITAISLDGLGNVSLVHQTTGYNKRSFDARNWTLVLNRTDTLEMWKLESGTYNSRDNFSGNLWDVGTVYVDKSVLIGGKIFWDLNENDLPDFNEGIDNVSISISSESGFDESVTTDEDGKWKILLQFEIITLYLQKKQVSVALPTKVMIQIITLQTIHTKAEL